MKYQWIPVGPTELARVFVSSMNETKFDVLDQYIQVRSASGGLLLEQS